ncbi:hypothetical protein F4805DRAFT_392366 [Annulohypoxylon moriforme]|nr:hypothetical protein F4805DRAFT_392366 [Annulohypoxylon moriforme]
MSLILLVSLITGAYGLCPPYPMGNGSTTLSQPTFVTTITIPVRPGSLSGNHTSSIVFMPFPTGANRGIGASTTSPIIGNLSNNATEPTCRANCSNPAIQTPRWTPVAFSSVPWSTDENPSLPSVMTIWPWPNNTSPSETSLPPPPEVPTYTPTNQTITSTVNVTVNLGASGCSSSRWITTTLPSTSISQTTSFPTSSSGGLFSVQNISPTTSGGNATTSHTVHAGRIPIADTRPGSLDQSPSTDSPSTVPITSFATPTTTPTTTIKVHPVTD